MPQPLNQTRVNIQMKSPNENWAPSRHGVERFTLLHWGCWGSGWSANMDLLYTQLTQIESLIWQLKYIYLHGHTMDRLVIHVLINNQRISFSCCQDIDILLWASQRAIKKKHLWFGCPKISENSNNELPWSISTCSALIIPSLAVNTEKITGNIVDDHSRYIFIDVTVNVQRFCWIEFKLMLKELASKVFEMWNLDVFPNYGRWYSVICQ